LTPYALEHLEFQKRYKPKEQVKLKEHKLAVTISTKVDQKYKAQRKNKKLKMKLPDMTSPYRGLDTLPQKLHFVKVKKSVVA
jgi:hypothetical protein